MMSQQNLPDFNKVTETVLKSRHHRRELELASIDLEELISRLEQDNRIRRSKYLTKVSSNQ